MIDINLLPSAQRRTVFTFDRTFSIGAGLLAALLLLVIVFDVVENVRIWNCNWSAALVSKAAVLNAELLVSRLFKTILSPK